MENKIIKPDGGSRMPDGEEVLPPSAISHQPALPSSQRTYKIYMLCFPNGKKYIGCTCQTMNRRMRGDIRPAVKEAIKEFGKENVKIRILSEGLSIEEAPQREVDMIALFKTTDPERGYNKDKGGLGNAMSMCPVRCIETGEEFESFLKCAKDMNLDVRSVRHCCLGERKTHKGYHFEFA